MLKKFVFVFCFFGAAVNGLWSQDYSAGFRAGLNFARFSGPSETSASGGELEEFSNSTGFHIGAAFGITFEETYGFRGELLYSQKGTQYNYAGESYWILEAQDNSRLYASGNRTTSLSITNSYIDIPVTAFYKLGRLELSAGVSAGILVGSRGAGEVIFSGQTATGAAVDPFTIALDLNYFSDGFRRTDIDDVEVRTIQGKTVEIPKTLGAYYQELEGKDQLFETLDFGLVGGLAFYLNQGLYLGLRMNYGLSDITKKERDISRKELDTNNNFILLDDKDRNVNLQASIGFSF
ncbi:MAG TPA: outer membrane beta-barrel protein [Saprospiraceae bacterium]|nr:outer membrane beta-barrel protein [Saprospiraceae bacterium]HMQ81538.1 outer membrane beta-barrel protein [Saprospiraceae bacterium]